MCDDRTKFTTEFDVTPSNLVDSVLFSQRVKLFVPQSWCFSTSKLFSNLTEKEAHSVEHLDHQILQLGRILMNRVGETDFINLKVLPKKNASDKLRVIYNFLINCCDVSEKIAEFYEKYPNIRVEGIVFTNDLVDKIVFSSDCNAFEPINDANRPSSFSFLN